MMQRLSNRGRWGLEGFEEQDLAGLSGLWTFGKLLDLQPFKVAKNHATAESYRHLLTNFPKV